MESFTRNNGINKNDNKKNIYILGHGLIDSNKFIITPEHIDLTFYVEKGKPLRILYINNIFSPIIKNGNPEHYISEKSLLNDMDIKLLAFHDVWNQDPYNIKKISTIDYSGIITEDISNIVSLSQLDNSVYKKYNIHKSKIEFIDKNTNKKVSSHEYMVLLNTYLNENLKTFSQNKNNYSYEIIRIFNKVNEIFNLFFNDNNFENKFNEIKDIIDNLCIYNLGIENIIGFNRFRNIMVFNNLVKYMNPIFGTSIDSFHQNIVSIILLHFSYQKSINLLAYINDIINVFNNENMDIIFKNIIRLSYHYHNDDIIPKEEIVDFNKNIKEMKFNINLGYILHKIDIYNKNILNNQKILCHSLNCRNYIPIESNRNINELQNLINQPLLLNEPPTLRRSNSVTVHRLIRQRSVSNEYKDLFQNIIEKCIEIISNNINYINKSNKHNNTNLNKIKNIHNKLMIIYSTYIEKHFLTVNEVKFLIHILRRNE